MFEPADADNKAAAAQSRGGSRTPRKNDRDAINDAGDQLSSNAAKAPAGSAAVYYQNVINKGDKTSPNAVGVLSSSSGGGEIYRSVMAMRDQLYSVVVRVASGGGSWGLGGDGGGGGDDGGVSDKRGGVDGDGSKEGQNEDVIAATSKLQDTGGERVQQSGRKALVEALRKHWKRWGEEFNEAVDGPWV